MGDGSPVVGSAKVRSATFQRSSGERANAFFDHVTRKSAISMAQTRSKFALVNRAAVIKTGGAGSKVLFSVFPVSFA